MHGVVFRGGTGKEYQPGQDYEVKKQAEGQQPLAKPQQPVSVWVLTQAAFQIQTQSAADPTVSPGQEKNHDSYQNSDQETEFQAVIIHQGFSFSDGRRELTRRFLGSSTGRPLR